MRRLLFSIVVCLLFVCAPLRGLAEEYSVTATVPAPLSPTLPVVVGPTTLEQPTSGVYITGTCAVIVPTLIVLLIRDAQTIGSGNCSASGTFSIYVGLVLGINVIYPQFMTITGDKGSFGDPITLTYKKAVSTPTNATEQNQQTPGDYERFGLLFDYDFVTYTDLKSTDLEYSVSGGVPPYVITVSWGDESQNKYTIATAGKQKISHTYKKILPPSKITITATDSLGDKTYQSRALVSFRQGVYVPPAPPEKQANNNWFVVWLIGAACFVVILFLVRMPHMQPTASKKAGTGKKR